MDFKQQRIEAIKNYLNQYSGDFSLEDLKNKLLKTGYSQQEINQAQNYQPQYQLEINKQTKEDFLVPQENNSIVNQASYAYHQPITEIPKTINYPTLAKKLIIVTIFLVSALLTWFLADKFIFYKGLKKGTHQINIEMESKEYQKNIVANIDNLEVTKDKVKLYVTIKNNLPDREYNMWGSIMGSFVIKDQKGEKLNDFKINYQHEAGGELSKSSIKIEAGKEAMGWSSFENPKDRRVKFITIEHQLFKTSPEIKL